ncbi:unnamed protein product [Sphagnum compactum]
MLSHKNSDSQHVKGAVQASSTLHNYMEKNSELLKSYSSVLNNVEKKRRLTFDQVRSLERNFELENKLEPERKMQLAKELGLQPRQVAVWFQNRRARWKTKQLERDYEVLSLDYNRMKAEYETIVLEKEKLKTEAEMISELVTQQTISEPAAAQWKQQQQPSSTPITVDIISSSKSKESKEQSTTSSGSNNSSEILDTDSPLPWGINNKNNNNNNNLRRESRKPVLCDCFELLNSSCWTVLSEDYIEFCIASWGAQKVIPVHKR